MQKSRDVRVPSTMQVKGPSISSFGSYSGEVFGDIFENGDCQDAANAIQCTTTKNIIILIIGSSTTWLSLEIITFHIAEYMQNGKNT